MIIKTTNTIDKCKLVKENGGLSINNSTFTDSGIECTNANLIISNCQVQNGVYCYNNDVVDVSGSSFTGAGNGIILNSCHNYSLMDNQITGMSGKGIGIYETNGTYNTIEKCTVSQNSGDGITFYHSNGNVIGCTIVGNNKGVVILQNSVVAINKEPGTNPNAHDSYIANNTWQEILFVNNCDLMMDGGKNQVIDNNYDHNINTFDKYLIQCPNLNHSVNLRENYWGYHDGSVNEHPIMPPADRFYPTDIYNAYVLDPVWSPGLPNIITNENDELMYHEAIDLAVENDVSGSIYLFKSIISEYPESHLVEACAKNLYALEQDKGALKDYYHTEPNLHWNSDIGKLADYLEKYCDIKIGNYQEAIYFFEKIISNPPSELDSLMAIIDLGYTYCMMQENPPKSAIMCMYPKLKPTSKKSFELSRDTIISCLYTQTGGEVPSNNGSETQIAIPILNKCYPNPFNPSTTISFILPKEMPCNLTIYNVKGQKIKTIVNETKAAGNYNVVWDGKDNKGTSVASGVYFYKLSTPTFSSTNKMMMLK